MQLCWRSQFYITSACWEYHIFGDVGGVLKSGYGGVVPLEKTYIALDDRNIAFESAYGVAESAYSPFKAVEPLVGLFLERAQLLPEFVYCTKHIVIVVGCSHVYLAAARGVCTCWNNCVSL